MTTTPFREALRKAYQIGWGDKQDAVDSSGAMCQDWRNNASAIIAKLYPAEDHARELLQVCEDTLIVLMTLLEGRITLDRIKPIRRKLSKAIASAKGKPNG